MYRKATFRLNSISLLAWAFVLAALFTFNACEDTTTNPDDNCSLTMNSFNVTPKTFAAGATLSGTVVVTETLNLDDFTIKGLTDFYLSADNTLSGSDTQLTAFVASNGLVANGNQTTIDYDQIEIPFGVSSGSYFILAHIDARPCGGGENTQAVTKSVSVTIN
ncbi:hypothetical protein C7N43_03020 [Sphingobacteriales bacterium UPWRP_1]|nr:hypothetical protein BVG80_09525 [Sphingobacteriales bacterium TSM_CSM]PSJ78589.1 hypothetical protein C7N43_03020 [Sphingobacteriales bacterium UPWRP_1]